MPNEELIYGLKNAIERGFSLEQAKHSFISAGYPLREVEEAAQSFDSSSYSSQSVPSLYEEQMHVPTSAVQKSHAPQQLPPILKPGFPETKTPNKNNWKIILLLGILAFLIIIFVLIFIFKDKIIGLFS